MRKTVRELYGEQLQDAFDSLQELKRDFKQRGDLVRTRDAVRAWRDETARIVETYGSREDSRFFRKHVDFDVVGISGLMVEGWFDSYEQMLSKVIERIPTADIRNGYADDVRTPLEQIDELSDWIADAFRRSMHDGELDYQTAEDSLRRWRDHAHKVLTDLVGEEEAGQIFSMTPAGASWGNPDGSIEEQYEMYLKYLRNLKDEIQKYADHLTSGVRPVRHGDRPSDYVNSTRLRELKGLSSANFDLSRLIALCEELNITSREGANHATGMLVRAIIDHVPPLFGGNSFSQVASNYSGSRSFKEAMGSLDSAARKISDAHLHTQIRKREILPTSTQVNFAPQIDLLLAEIVRILK